MKFVLFVVVGTILSIAVVGAVWNSTSCPYSPKQTEPARLAETAGERHPVLVELFTSEGCSSCPPADRQLTFLHQNQPVRSADIVTLAFHVDYWDRLGWKDRFSSAQFSARQNSYTLAKHLDSSYTPQMIVDGGAQFVGSDARKADATVTAASKTTKGKVSLSIDGGKLNTSIADLPDHESAEVLLAIAEDKLETNVLAGENSGSKLAHTGVVRSLKQLGEIGPAENRFETLFSIPSSDGWKAENLRYVVWVQEKETRRVIAVGYFSTARG